MALNGVDIAHNPAVFYKTIVQVKNAQNISDGDLVNALEFLRSNSGGDLESVGNLGFIYFKNKDMKRALDVLSPMIKNNIKAVRTDSLMLAAEAARQQGETKQALSIINAANKLHPKDISVLNNLVYYLAMNPATVARARLHLKSLLENGEESFEILDTVAMVYLYSGDIELAQKYMDKAIAIMPKDDPRELEMQLNRARILFKGGSLQEAQGVIRGVERDPDRNFIVDKKSKVLLEEVEKAIRDNKKVIIR